MKKREPISGIVALIIAFIIMWFFLKLCDNKHSNYIDSNVQKIENSL